MRGTMWLAALGCGILLSSSGCCGFLQNGGCGRGCGYQSSGACDGDCPTCGPAGGRQRIYGNYDCSTCGGGELRRVAARVAAIVAKATSASIPSAGLGACSMPAPGAAQAAATRTGARRSAIRPLAMIHATATANGPVAAGARVAIRGACGQAATCRRCRRGPCSRTIRSPNRRLPHNRRPRPCGGPRQIATIDKAAGNTIPVGRIGNPSTNSRRIGNPSYGQTRKLFCGPTFRPRNARKPSARRFSG